MNADQLKLPAKGFTKAERAWLTQLIEAIKSVRAISGRNVSISDDEQGQTVNADDCQPCP